MQKVFYTTGDYSRLDDYFKGTGKRKLLLVCESSISFLALDEYFNSLQARLGIETVRFMDFEPNPKYECVVKGVKAYKENGCDMIAAVGGGSAIDVAKCIKLYEDLDESKSYLEQEPKANDIILFAAPTTAGTGSEATRYAVIYANGEKQSITHESIIPSAVLFDPRVLKTLPLYQKKATMMDALCHAVESFWSVNSTEESKGYSTEAIRLILENMESYLAGDESTFDKLMQASNIAGKAINITQTTAGHAMCYKLTSLYGISHGHAAALCVKALFPYMAKSISSCIDPRGEEYLRKTFEELAAALGCDDALQASEKFVRLVDSLDFAPLTPKEGDIDILKTSVNPVRLKNNPIGLDVGTIEKLYIQVTGGKTVNR